jgi:hypothetical protein
MKVNRDRRHAGALLLLLTACVYGVIARPFHMRWGATDAELAMRLPSDSLIPTGSVVSTRAITIDAPQAVVWRWLAQLGQGRGGFYSYTWLENLFDAEMRNADSIVPALQELRAGDRISYQQDGPSDRVSHVEPGCCFTIGNGWQFYLQALEGDRTRLIVRYASDVASFPGGALFYYPIFEPAHFVMESGMMLGIKARAERSWLLARPAAVLMKEEMR